MRTKEKTKKPRKISEKKIKKTEDFVLRFNLKYKEILTKLAYE
jgi:hypothetical protein